jgi:hypothetical protein
MIADTRTLPDYQFIFPWLERALIQARADPEHPPLAALRRCAAGHTQRHRIPLLDAEFAHGPS